MILFLLIVSIIKNERQLKLAFDTWLIATGLVILFAFIGIVMGYGFKLQSPFVQFYENYPYIGQIYRPQSTLRTAKMLSSYLIPGVTLSLSFLLVEKDKLRRILLSGLILAIFIIMGFSFSRGIFGLGVGVFIVLLRAKSRILRFFNIF